MNGKTARPLSPCCSEPYLWLTCDECEVSGDDHDFATCSKCGQDIDD